MVNTILIKMIVLCLNLVLYSSGAEEAQIDMLNSGEYAGTITYKVENKKMKVSFIDKKKSVDMMTIATVDNGLYSVKLNGETPFQADLAQYFMEIDWKNIRNINRTIRHEKDGPVKFSTSPGNLYVKHEKTTFVINKKLLLKKK